MSRAVVVASVLGAALADRAGWPTVAFYALLVAVPACCAVVLSAIGDLVDGVAARVRTALELVVLALVLAGAAARSPAVTEGVVPGLARSALLACLGVFCVQAFLAFGSELRRREPATAVTRA